MRRGQMPLYETGAELIRKQLEEIREGRKVKAIRIGMLTPTQLCAINAERERQKQPPIIDEVLFLGTHAYRSRVTADRYAIADVVDQIASAMSSCSIVTISPK